MAFHTELVGEARIIEARLLVELGRPEGARPALDALAGVNCAAAYLTVSYVFNALLAQSAKARSRLSLLSADEAAIAAARTDPGCGSSTFAYVPGDWSTTRWQEL